ncbi:MAG TPA: EAL domain-containing protein [Hyphomicrobium sp.]|nr:EAL domain-containing protein [Hyphomicrobium sp.]
MDRRLSRSKFAARILLALLWSWLAGTAANALEPIAVQPDLERIEITTLGDAYEGRGDSLQVETAAGTDGVTGRMTVRSSVPGANPNWMVFALTNKTDKPMERWLTADRYTVSGSGTVWPDLDARRIEAVTPSIGFVPERVKSDKADVFRITLEPGQTITYVAELSTERFARLYLWKPIDYEVKTRDRQLFNGAMLGLTGLLAIFLTAVFAANHKIIFPAAALVSWSVLTYLCVDFGFFHKLFNLRPEDNAVYRAATESAIAASFVIFLSTFLRLSMWHGLVRMLIGVWIVAQLSLVAVSVIDPRLSATFARLSFLAIGGAGGMFTLYLAARGQDRALSLVPTWVLFLVWIFAAGMTLSGRLSGDVVVAGLVAGLVLVVILLGFTVTQFAFRSLDPVYAGAPTELQARSLALAGSGSIVWEWNIRRDEFKVGPEIEMALALMPGELSCKVDDFLRHVHPTDKERFRVMLVSAQERAGVKIRTDFRLRHADNSWRWFELEAASVPNADGRTLRCVGLIRDVSDSKRAQERLLHDAVHCSLTGLPNRELFLDRLKTAVARAKTDTTIRPSVIFIDLDKFKSVNASFGLVRGDSLLLTVARRLQRHLGAHDTAARVGGDQFAMLFIGEQDARNLAALAERVRRSLRAPIPLANQEIVLTGSIGIAIWSQEHTLDDDLLKEAELAMYRAKRGGADRIEVFEPEMRRDRDDRIQVESDLRKALEKGQLKVLYQPIVYLPTKELAGFEALVRWDHPKHGMLNPIAFVPVAEESDLIIKLGSHVLMRAAKDCAKWQAELPRADRPLFVSVNVSSRQLFKPESVQEIRHILGRNIVPRGTLRLEITETLVMENPEQAVEILETLRGAGAELALDDFGTGYSSLAYLQRFPFDTVKIDRELVRASNSGSGAAIMRSIVALSHELSKKVVAEGVEHAEEAVFLRTIGCEYAQGYHFGEPISERDVSQLLKMVRRSEKRLQPRGFFRPTTKSKKSIDTTAPADGVPVEIATTGLAEAANAKPQALPARAVVRPRQKAPAQTPQQNGAGKPGSNIVAPPAGLAPAALRETTGRPVPPIPQSANPPTSQPPRQMLAHNGQVPMAQPVLAPMPLAMKQPLAEALARVVPPGGIPSPASSMPPGPPFELPTAPVAMQPAPVPPNSMPQGSMPPVAMPPAPTTSYAPMPPPQMSPMPPPLPPLPQRTSVAPPAPDFSNLPPGVAASLARLAAGNRTPQASPAAPEVSDTPTTGGMPAAAKSGTR